MIKPIRGYAIIRKSDGKYFDVAPSRQTLGDNMAIKKEYKVIPVIITPIIKISKK